ncbi:unnamed protein product [Peronospora destructor]|uniref:Fe2OG dioxygenase domain-containing protein n=1 Tax=Peronospora destructor TaxID=86335 RepID=A0AAV0T9Y7_9STRA|nr:unnamed protein product [Peronospora destructor]
MVTIPEVDFSSTNAAEQLRIACTQLGFCYVLNHGISDDRPDSSVQGDAEFPCAFFSQPIEEKQKVLANKYMRGYTLMNEETLDPAVQTRGDTKEDKAKFPTLQETMEKYYVAMCKLGFEMAKLFAEAAGEKGKFDGPGMFDKPMAALRLLHYAPEKSDVEKGVFGAGAHTDYGLITLLSTDTTGGLQIFYEGKWVDVPPRDDVFVVNIGDMTERFTNREFKSTLHRVMNVSGEERYSVPFFFDPNFTCKVECFSSCVSEEDPARYPPTTSGQHLLDKYKQTHASFDAQ